MYHKWKIGDYVTFERNGHRKTLHKVVRIENDGGKDVSYHIEPYTAYGNDHFNYVRTPLNYFQMIGKDVIYLSEGDAVAMMMEM